MFGTLLLIAIVVVVCWLFVIPPWYIDLEEKPMFGYIEKNPILAFSLFTVVVALFWLFAIPPWNVWASELKGKAELVRAQQNRMIRIEEANATKESAKSLAEAEVIRAHGVAEANKIIGESLKGNEGYLRYLWIQGLQEGTSPQVVYVPTEAGLPILEAGRIAQGK